MIQNADFSRYRVAELIQLLNNASQIIESHNPVDLKITSQHAALQTAITALDGEYKKQTSSSITATLAELDERRDDALTGILRVVSGFEYHFDATKQAAARRIGLIVNKYGTGVTRLRYQQETGDINSLVSDLLGDAAATAAITALGLADWVEELRLANQEFDKAYVQRAQEMAGDSSQVLALRAAAQQKWQDLAAHLTAHSTLTPGALFTKTIAELNSLIDDYKNATANRAGEVASPAPAPTPPGV